MNKAFYYFPIFLVLYLIIAVSGRAFYEKREFYPAFAWSLYSKIPAFKVRHAIYITEVKGNKLGEELNLFDHIRYSNQSGTNLRRMMIRYKDAYLKKDKILQEKIIEEIKATILKPDVTKFRMGFEEYFSLERFLHKKIIKKSFITEDISNATN